jgi:hypothetical protein
MPDTTGKHFTVTLPTDIPPGVYFVAFVHNFVATSGNFTSRGQVLFAPIYIDTRAPVLSTNKNDLGLSLSPLSSLLQVTLLWPGHEYNANYNVALRLRDLDGNEFAAHDSQPAYGFYPTSMWREGETVPDIYRLPFSTPPHDGNYLLSVALYDPSTLATVGNPKVFPLQFIKGEWQRIDYEHVFTAPVMAQPLEATFGDAIQLIGYDVERDTTQLHLTVAWRALQVPSADYKFFVHLIGADEAIVTQADGFPRSGTYPTSQWQPNEIITDTVTLPLENVQSGTYRFALGWYNPVDLVRLPATQNNIPLDFDRLVLPETLVIP